MRIAFTSCTLRQRHATQNVWDWIATQNPDHLVLLGDNIYLDIDVPGDDNPPKRLRDMNEPAFAALLHQRYAAQLAQPQFDALVRKLGPGRVHAIWDDHDFLWNNAAGAAVRKIPAQRDKIPLSNAYFALFRQALSTPGSFPSAPDASLKEPAPATPSLELEPGLWLHLSDSRSWRTETTLVGHAKRQLLGEKQRNDFSAAMAPHPNDVHLFANGSTSSDWTKFPNDWDWLKAQAATRRTLFLTGDLHYNDVDAFHTGGFPLHEAIASGAAIKDGVIVGDLVNNYGLLDVSAQAVELRMYSMNVETKEHYRRYSRQTWLPMN